MDTLEEAREVARAEAGRMDLAADDPHIELMATHAALGDLLGPGAVDAAGVAEYRRLVRHLADVGSEVVDYEQQRFAVWQSRITTECGA